MALADHIVVMNQGEILQADAPGGIYNFPSCMFVARFIGAAADELRADRRRGACRR
jgi:multiple sugar transport system ATP-binding protein